MLRVLNQKMRHRLGFILPSVLFLSMMLMMLMGAVGSLFKQTLDSGEMIFEIEADMAARHVVTASFRNLYQYGTMNYTAAVTNYYSNYNDFPYWQNRPPAGWPSAHSLVVPGGYTVRWYVVRMCAHHGVHATNRFCHVMNTGLSYTDSNSVINQVAFLFYTKVEDASGRSRYVSFYQYFPILVPANTTAYEAF